MNKKIAKYNTGFLGFMFGWKNTMTIDHLLLLLTSLIRNMKHAIHLDFADFATEIFIKKINLNLSVCIHNNLCNRIQIIYKTDQFIFILRWNIYSIFYTKIVHNEGHPIIIKYFVQFGNKNHLTGIKRENKQSSCDMKTLYNQT